MLGRKLAVKARTADYFRARYTETTARGVQGLFNHKCFWNAVEYALQSETTREVVEVIAIDDGWPCLHYVVREGGELLEVTLGHRAQYSEYYVLRDIPRKDWPHIGHEFERARSNWNAQLLTWLDRLAGVDTAL